MKHVLTVIICALLTLWSIPVFAQNDIQDRLTACEQRQGDQFDAIAAILEAEGVPRDFIYLMCAESTGNADKCSPQNACGLWQLTPATARRFGLTVNGRIDERLDTTKATYAAAAYLRTLLDMFDDDNAWAVAAYNTGGHNLRRAVRYEKGMKVRVIRDYFPQAYNLVYTFQKMRELAK